MAHVVARCSLECPTRPGCRVRACECWLSWLAWVLNGRSAWFCRRFTPTMMGAAPRSTRHRPPRPHPPKELPALPFGDGPLAVMVDGGCPCAGLRCRRGAASGPSSRHASPRWGGGGAVRYGSVARSDGSGGGADTCLRTPGPGARVRTDDDQRSTLKRPIVDATDGVLRRRGVVEFDTGHPPCPPAVPIRRTDSACHHVAKVSN
jgi:hypothetical protein